MKFYNAWYCPFTTTAFEQGDYERRMVEHYYPYSLGEGQTDVTRV